MPAPNPLNLVLPAVAANLSRTIAASTPARALLAGLAGRSMAVRLVGLGLRVHVRATDAGLELGLDEEPADAEVSGAPLSLLALMRQSAPTAGNAGITIHGDPEVLQTFQKLFRFARPDLEAELARFVGDAPAHLAGRFVAKARALAERVHQTATGSLAEYLTEESRDLAARTEVEAHRRDVDRLRDDVERAQARLALLESRAKAARP